ncbi:hypothetical protein AXF42_Ash006414 [Apostasia shenzhenica]|uniref:Uncharacterized protein n=1 Tax=Apostasia shenzhenica TaxID=1088818 RepID=A0A2I0AZ06_9ASPA|nr:hypothetical protein AXF42_Ash006414 [Apostasia shenzhenica]
MCWRVRARRSSAAWTQAHASALRGRRAGRWSWGARRWGWGTRRPCLDAHDRRAGVSEGTVREVKVNAGGAS